LLSACTDDGDGGDSQPSGTELQAIRDATFAAGSARYEGEIRFADGASGPLTGVAGGDPARGAVTLAVLTPEGPRETEATWLDGTIYLARVPASGAVSPPLFGRSEADLLRWVQLPHAGLGRVVIAPYDPFSLLEWLDASSLQTQPDGSEQVDGESFDRLIVDTSNHTAAPGGADRIELLADDDDRLATVRLAGDVTVEYSLSEYGVEVDAVAPPADQVVQPGTARPTGEERTGPYELVAEGTAEGLPWTLVRATATNGGFCWRLDADSLTPVAPTAPDGATCISGVEPDTPIDEQVQIVADPDRDSPLDAIVAVVPPGSSARLAFADRTSQELAVDPAGFVVWVGPKQPLAVVLDVTAPDGARAACGPGPVSEIGDLDSLPISDIAELADAPWLCLSGA